MASRRKTTQPKPADDIEAQPEAAPKLEMEAAMTPAEAAAEMDRTGGEEALDAEVEAALEKLESDEERNELLAFVERTKAAAADQRADQDGSSKDEDREVKVAAKSTDRVRSIWNLLTEIDDEERIELQRLGVSAPIVMSKDTRTVWGYRCNHCGEIALEFVGESFVTPHGTMHEVPTGIPFSQLAWIQPESKQPGLMPRDKPCCQHCTLEVKRRRYFVDRRYVVKLEDWRQSRDEAILRLRKARMRRRRSEGNMADKLSQASTVTNTDGTPITMRDAQSTKLSTDDAFGSARQGVEDLTDRHGLLDRAFPALARGE